MSAVLIVLGSGDQRGSDWIQMDVSHEFSEVAVGLAQYRLIAALKDVTHLLVFSVVVLAVAGKDSLHDAADWIVLHLDEQVEVIGHEAVGVKEEGELGFLIAEEASQ
jgi:hypothetical protein